VTSTLRPAALLGHGWVVLREGARLRLGGDLRRRYLLDGLARRATAVVVDDWQAGSIGATLLSVRGRRWQGWRRSPFIATSELMTKRQLETTGRLRIPLAIDRLVGPPAQRLIVAPNGTDSALVRPVSPPALPTVGLVSGAAPGRGIEALAEACRIVWGTIPEVRLLVFLVGTGDRSQAYLDGMVLAVRDQPWIEIGTASYAELGVALGRASVLCIPTPAHPYWTRFRPSSSSTPWPAGGRTSRRLGSRPRGSS
jgi:glycosyltransferase involved in cell wall biosynthesis